MMPSADDASVVRWPHGLRLMKTMPWFVEVPANEKPETANTPLIPAFFAAAFWSCDSTLSTTLSDAPFGAWTCAKMTP